MDTQRYRELLAHFPKVRVLVVGDIYLDEMVEGAVTEVSLEAPIPVFEVHERRHNPGAAGNAACNAAALGATTHMIGVIGADMNGEIVRREFAARGVETSGVVVDPSRPTSTYGKLRAGGHNIPTQEILRMDTPRPKLITGAVEEQVCANIRKLAPEVDAIMVGDQVSSTITDRVLDTVRACAAKHGLFTLADSRARAGMFRGIDVIKPNDKEAALASGVSIVDDGSLCEAGKKLLGIARNVLITLGPKGIMVFGQDGLVENVPVLPCSVVDVTGAGDTVAAAVTLAMCSGGALLEAAFLGNAAAGIAVGREGAVTVSLAELETLLFSERRSAKVKTAEEMKPILEELRRKGKRIVWTNGCFDILHVGHITYLMHAKQKGDVLIVGLNSDASVRENKGPSRPVIGEQDRAVVLSALECVDYIVIFDGKTPMPLLEALKPDVYAKGGDYTLGTIVQEERRLVEGYGGEIAIIPGVEGHSTTAIINRLTQEQ